MSLSLNYPLKKEFTNVEVCDENSLKFAFVELSPEKRIYQCGGV
jgi:hypothetical protein